MSDALIVTFQSQLSVVMETVLKSAMVEITRLVEDSFMEEVSRGRQQVELLLRRLQSSECKLQERERRVCCADCGRAVSERRSERAAETLAGEDALCFRLSLREQSEKRAEVWRSTEALDSYIPADVQNLKEKDVLGMMERSQKPEAVCMDAVQLPQNILQTLPPGAAASGVHEARSNIQPKESPCKSPAKEFIPNTETRDDRAGDLAPSPSSAAVKPELATHPDLVAIKEEEEMLPLWDGRDDGGPGDTDQRHAAPWSHDESQVDTFPHLSALNMPDPSSHLMSYSVSCNTEVTKSMKVENEAVSTDLLALPPRSQSGSVGSNENGHLFELCSGKKLFLPIPLPQSAHLSVPERTAKSFPLPAHRPISFTLGSRTSEAVEHPRQQHPADRPHVCPTCGKAFTRYSNFKQHQNIHTHEKLFNCVHCGMRFKRSTHLRVHLRRHSRVGKNCPCRQCGKTFVCLKQLKGHLLKVHGTEMRGGAE